MSADQLTRIEDKLDKALAWQAGHEATAAARQKIMDEHHDALFGNGKPGLKATVQDLDRDVKAILQTCRDNHPPQHWLDKVWPPVLSGLVLFVVVAVLSWGVGIWKLHAEAAAPPTATSRPAK